MSTIQEVRRTARVDHNSESNADVLTITERRGDKATCTHYRLERNPNAKHAWRLHKLVFSDEGPTVYDVDVSGQWPTCDCLGFLAHNRCKHTLSLLALLKHGRLR